MILSLEMRCSIRCNDCSVRNPLPGLREKTNCVQCGTLCDVIAVHKDACTGGVTYNFGGYHDSVTEALIEEDGFVLAEGDGYIIPTRLVRKPATCSCGAALPIPEADATSVTCSSCKDVIAVRWPDDSTRKWDARIWCIVGDSNEHDEAKHTKKKEGEVIACKQCGAALAPEGNRRTATCTYCHAVNFLSDAQRTQLFPKSLDHPFFLLYRLTDEKVLAMVNGMKDLEHGGRKGRARVRAEIAARQKEEDDRVLAESGPLDHEAAVKIAKRDDLTDEQMRHFDSRLTDKDRKALRGGKVSAPICTLWATSADADVRAYAATHLEADSPLIDPLVKDHDAGVRAQVARRNSITAAQINLLTNDEDASVRAAVASSQHT
ncbi:MAG: hypothetical protein ABI183_26310, partial [Polyangiaceae bacterium]